MFAAADFDFRELGEMFEQRSGSYAIGLACLVTLEDGLHFRTIDTAAVTTAENIKSHLKVAKLII